MITKSAINEDEKVDKEGQVALSTYCTVTVVHLLDMAASARRRVVFISPIQYFDSLKESPLPKLLHYYYYGVTLTGQATYRYE